MGGAGIALEITDLQIALEGRHCFPHICLPSTSSQLDTKSVLSTDCWKRNERVEGNVVNKWMWGQYKAHHMPS